MDRDILHVDMNNFYASVEGLSKPELKDKPFAVCGDAKKRHGIILAKNQIAKEYGVKTAEAIWQAQRKCPDLVLVPPHHEKYEFFSKKATEIYSRFTDVIENFGIDECWLDVTNSKDLFGSAKDIGEAIRKTIKEELGLTVSVGVSFNKVFAKLASDYNKPDALTEITKENYKEIVWKLPVTELLYVGKSTANSLLKFGVSKIGELAELPFELAKRELGKNGEMLWNYANGIDNSPVLGGERELKSIGNSTTLAEDITSSEDVKKVLLELSEQVAQRLREKKLWANSLQVSIKRSNFEYYQKSCTLTSSVSSSGEIFEKVYLLYKLSKETAPIRSLGVRAEKLSKECNVQYSLFDEKNVDCDMELEKAKDEIRNKYGNNSIKRAILIQKNHKLY